MTTKKDEDKTVEDGRSYYDHENGVLVEPKPNDTRVMRHQVDPIRDPAIVSDEGNGPIPRTGDPFAHQRDTKAAEKAAKEEAKESEKKAAKAESDKGDAKK